MSNRYIRRSSAFIIAGVCAVLLAGCGSSDNNGGTNNQNQALVRTYNAYIPVAGTSGTLNITNNGTSLSGASGVQFGQFFPTSGYTPVSSGTFNPTGTGQGINTPLAFTNPVTLNGNNAAYTVVATGLSGQTGTLAPQLMAIPDYSTSLGVISGNNAAVRVINLSGDNSTLGLYSTLPGQQATVINGLSTVPYGYTPANNQYVTMPVTSLTNLSLRTTANPTTDLTLSNSNIGSYNFLPGHAYTVYVNGQTGNTIQPMSAFIAQDFPQTL